MFEIQMSSWGGLRVVLIFEQHKRKPIDATKGGTECRPYNIDITRNAGELCLKSRNQSWIESVQGAVATWSVNQHAIFPNDFESQV
jgi:hypothetical protein